MQQSFVDIPKIMAMIDPNKAASFLQKNQAAKRESKDECGCHTTHTKFFMERRDMSSIDKAICGTITSKKYFADNMPFFLDRVNQAQTSLLTKAKA